MGARAAKAPDFSGVLANTAVNKDTLQLSPTSCSTSNIDPELNDLQKYLLPILAKNLTGDDINSESTLSTLKELKAMKTNKEVCDYVAKTRG